MADEKKVNAVEEPVKKKNQIIEVLKRMSDNKGAMVGGILFIIVLVIAIIAPLIAPYDYSEMNILDRLQTPSLAHIFGTDHMGRDVFSRIVYGARYSLIIGIGSVIFSAVFGIILGSISGYFGGWVDNLIMRICDIIQSIPGLILNIVLACAMGAGVVNIVIALGVEGIAGTARLMRSSILNVRKMEYLDAATVSNCNSLQIISKHVFPNTFAPILVQATMGVGARIITAASLSYMGIGVLPPTPEWGAMLADSRDYLMNNGYLCLIPGICIMVVVLSLNLLGDGLRDALDPKLKK